MTERAATYAEVFAVREYLTVRWHLLSLAGDQLDAGDRGVLVSPHRIGGAGGEAAYASSIWPGSRAAARCPVSADRFPGEA